MMPLFDGLSRSMEYYIAVLLAVAGLNWFAGRRGSVAKKRFTFALSAAAPIILWAGLNLWFLIKDGAATFENPYFLVLLTMAVGATVMTTVAAFLGVVLATAGR